MYEMANFLQSSNKNNRTFTRTTNYSASLIPTLDIIYQQRNSFPDSAVVPLTLNGIGSAYCSSVFIIIFESSQSISSTGIHPIKRKL